MENKEKLRILLQHWIDHNKGHANEFAKWQETMKEEGNQEIAHHISHAIGSMEKVNEYLTAALQEAGGEVEEKGEGHHHHHHHH